MGVIMIYGDRFSAERELAQTLATHLGYRLITPEVVIERAAAWGGSREKMARILSEPPRLFDRFLRETRKQLLFLRAALAEGIRGADVVCYGELADLLVQDHFPVVRIAIRSSRESRIKAAGWDHNLNILAAAAVLKRADSARKAWRRLIYGEPYSAPAPDLVLNLDRTGLAEACDTITDRVRQLAEACQNGKGALLDNLAISSRVDAALAADPATAHLELAVEGNRGQIQLQGRTRNPQDPVEVKRVVQSVQGVSQVTLNGEVLGEREVVAATANDRRFTVLRARPAYLALGLTLAGVLIFSALAGKFESLLGQAAYTSWLRTPEAFQGMITDSRCGNRHSQTEPAQCVRACVAQGAQYVLDDGKRLYKLSDQCDAERYAGRKVKVNGFLGEDSRYLKVSSMQPL